jgi:hypothetical protein
MKQKLPQANRRRKHITNTYIGKDDVIALFLLSGNDPSKLPAVTPNDVERVRRRMEVIA